MKIENIKFKAKRLDNAEWVEGYYVKKVAHKQTPKGDVVEDGEEHLIFGMTKTDVQPYWYEVDPSTVCQFTGLKDKDGKEVWEHDIFSPYEGCSYSCEVIFEKSSFKALSHKGRVRMPILNGIDYFNWKLRVIGNKFDRKEGE